jgi:Tol biopolymer transport system component
MAATTTTASRTTPTRASCRRASRPPEASPEASRRRPRARAWCLLLLLARAAAGPPAAPAQGPEAPWRTLTTAHFRVHFPAPFAAWAERAAAWLELARQRTIAEIGFTPADQVDVVVSDPLADANGEAFPLRGWPRLILWTTPPPPDSELGNYRDWIEDLVIHEEAHLVHLLRPSRHPLLAGLLPVSPIALAPRWVVEGYATLIEGRLTGAGRPNGDLRAAILRRWAQAGRLPDYGALAADRESWRGMSMAYLLGSAYLEWLEQRAGPGSLRRLWARMTARTGRDFDAAFAGIWGNSPRSLYDRFRAELTWRSMEAERRVQAVAPLAQREGPLWQELTWTTGAPAVSPDGGRIALVRRDRDRPAELVIWATAPDTAAEQRWQDEQARLAARDPEDVPAVRTKPLPRQPLAVWRADDGGDPTMPRFLPDGRSLLLVRFLPDHEGVVHPDLFIWRPGDAHLRRLTWQAGLRDPDPAADGTWAVAVREQAGQSQLVTVDLASGTVHELTAPSVERLYDRPRVSPDGRRVAFGMHDGGGWRLAVLELRGGGVAAEGASGAAANPDVGVSATKAIGALAAGGPGSSAHGTGVTGAPVPAAWPLAGRLTRLVPPAGGTVSAPAWSPDGRTLYAVVGRGGFIDIHAFAAPSPPTAAEAAGTGADSRLTAQGGARPAADGSAGTEGRAGPGAQEGTGTVDMATPAPRALTRTQGAAFAPAPTPDGKGLFYLSLEPYGLDLRRLDLTVAHPPLAEVVTAEDLAPAVRPPPAASPPSPLPPSDSLSPVAAPAFPASAPESPKASSPAAVTAVQPSVSPSPLPSSPQAALPTPVPIPSRPYGAGRQELLPLLGGHADSAGSTLELGLRAGDLIGRLDMLALGGIGSPGQPRGGTLAGTWRGLPAALDIQLFDVTEQPSRQPALVPPGAPVLDLERRGAEAASSWERQGPGQAVELRTSFLFERLLPAHFGGDVVDGPFAALPASSVSVSPAAPGEGRATGEEAAQVTGSYRLGRRFGLWRVGSTLDARLGAGRTGGDGWTRYGVGLGFAVRRDDFRLGLAWRRDGSQHVSQVFDLYQLGGAATGLLPPGVLANRLLSPALPAAVLLGAEHEEERAELTLSPLPLPLFYERHSLWGGLLPQARVVSLAGFEYHAMFDAYPLVRIPAVELRLGAARVLSDPLRDHDRWWLLTVWRP